MNLEKVEAGPVAGPDLRSPVLANCSEHSHLAELRKRHLSEVFDLPGDTALVLAELAFGLEGAR